jgi:Calx-beta domain
MKISKILILLLASLCVPALAQAQFFNQPGTYGYALNSNRHVMDMSPDGKFGITLTNDPVSGHPARLGTFDPLLGTPIDSETFGFGPLGVNLAQISNSLRVVVLTSEGGPRKLWLFDLNATMGTLSQLASTQLTASNSDAGGSLVLSASGQVGFVIVAPNTGFAGMDLVCFSLVDGSIVSRTQIAGGGEMIMNETGGKRTLGFLKDTATLELFDATNPALPSKIGDIPLPKNSEFSGTVTSGSLAFSGDGRYVFVAEQFADFAVVDTLSLQVISSIGGATNRFVRVRVYEDSQRRLLALQGAPSGTTGSAFIRLVDATDPFHLATTGQNNTPGALGYKGDLAFSHDGSRLYALGSNALIAYNLPDFSDIWQQIVPSQSAREQQLIVYGPTDELRGAWDLINGTANSAVIGSFPANPPTITTNNVTINEGDAGTIAANFPIVLSAPSNHRVTVNYSTGDGTATRPSDYTSASGSLVFEPGETVKVISLDVIGDTIDEYDETFQLFLNSVVGILATPQVTCTIVDNDPPPMLTVSDAISTEGNSGSRNATFTIKLGSQTAKQLSVDYTTSDQTATAGVDYTARSGTLTFSTNQTSATLTVPITGDTAIEPDETFQLMLSNPQNVTLERTTATGTIISDDSATGNPLDLTGFFVRQQYLDFLSREPDVDGFTFWTNNINTCGADAQCTEVERINTSGAFFLSIEFQQTGYLVERFYKCAFGDGTGGSTLNSPHQISVPIVRRNEFSSDTALIAAGVVALQPGWEQVLENHKQSFADYFVIRARFANDYPGSMSPADFVDKLNERAGNPLSPAERDQLVNDLLTSAKTRGQVLRAIAEHPNLAAAEFNRAFVLMQYFGYLRRNPNDPQDSDYTGYDFWLTKLNQFNGNFIDAEMVKAFITSIEYRKRFGP